VHIPHSLGVIHKPCSLIWEKSHTFLQSTNIVQILCYHVDWGGEEADWECSQFCHPPFFFRECLALRTLRCVTNQTECFTSIFLSWYVVGIRQVSLEEKGGKKKTEGILAHSSKCFGFWNASSPFIEDKFWLVKCPPNTLK
jgi:hypothetical protein